VSASCGSMGEIAETVFGEQIFELILDDNTEMVRVANRNSVNRECFDMHLDRGTFTGRPRS